MGCANNFLFFKKEANIDWPIIQYFWNIGYSPIEVGISLDQSLEIETNVLPYGPPFHFIYTSVACAVGPSVNPLQNRETQHANIVLQCMYRVFEQPNMKGFHA